MLRFAAVRLEVLRPVSICVLVLLALLPAEALSRPEVTYLGNLNFRLTVDLEELEIGTVEIEGQTYSTFDLPGARHLRGDSLVGLPDLPVLDLAALLPEGTQVASIDTVSATVVRLVGEYLPAPIQPEPDPRHPRPPAPPNPEVYGSRFPYPARAGQEGRDGSMRGFFLGGFQVSPIRFYGLFRRIEVLTEIEIRVRVEPFDTANRGSIRKRSELRSRYSAHGDELRWVMNHVANATDLETLYPSPHQEGRGGGEQTPHGGFLPTERPSESGPPVAYVVITNNTNTNGAGVGDLVAEFQRLADWKTEKGVPAVVRAVDWIEEEYEGADTQARIRSFVIDAYEKWGTDWVLLGGDIEIVPERVIGGLGDALTAAAYYGCLDESWNHDGDEHYDYAGLEQSDPLWDVWVGRLPVDTVGDAEAVIDKLFTYERVPGFGAAIPDAGYYDNFLALAGATNSLLWDDNSGFFVAEDITLNMVLARSMSATRIYETFANPADTTCMTAVKRQICPGGVPIYSTWGSGDAQAALEDGHALVFHAEHSTSEFLGGPSRYNESPCLADGELGQTVITSDANRLTNGPAYSVIVSMGSITNSHNLDSISERFLLNPNGGAVAYVGKSSRHQNNAGGVDTMFFKEMLINEFEQVGQALAFATQDISLGQDYLRAPVLWTLLGDPEMSAWSALPRSFEVEVDPIELASAAPTHIAVAVSDSSHPSPVEGALVALKQGVDAYAYKLTDSDGIATFDFYPTSTDEDVLITVTGSGYLPKQVELPFDEEPSGPPWVVYESHETAEETGNGVNGIEAGEQWEIAVTVNNIGAEGSPVTSAKLRPLGAVTMTLRIDGAYDPSKIFIGRYGAHPPQGFADTSFTLPAAEWNGVSAFGRPNLLDSSVTGFFVWRDTTGIIGPGVPGQDWRIIFKQVSGGSSKFTGTIVAPGEFSATRSGGFEGGDSLWAGGQVVTFKTFSASADPDSILFNARNTKWVAMIDSLAEYSTVDPGETATGVDGDLFEFALKASLPDREELLFELVTDWFQFASSGTATSEFLLHTSAPSLEERLQVVSLVGGFFSPLPIDLKPTIWNAGTGRADNVVAWLTSTGVVAANMVTNHLVLGAIGPGELKTPSTGFRFNLGAGPVDTAGARFRLDLTNHYANGETLRVTVRSDIDLLRPTVRPNIQSLDPTPNGVWVVWDATGSTLADLRGYNLYAGGERINARTIERTRRAFVPGLDPESSYSFYVVLEDSSGNESPHPSGGHSQSTSWAFAEEWPKRMDSHALGNMQPTVADVDGDGRLEAFVGGINVYAWHLDDGSELIDGDDDPSTDGVFYATPDSAWSVVIGRAWGAPFAIADLDSTPDGVFKEIVGVTTPLFNENSILFVWNRDGSVKWTYELPGRAFPCAAPVVVDLDQDGEGKEILLLADDGAPAGGSLYIWEDDKSAYGAAVRYITGIALPLSNSPAVGDLHSSPGLEIAVGRPDALVQVFRSDVATGLWLFTPPGSCEGRAFRSSTPVIGNIDASTEELELAVIMADDEGESFPNLVPPITYLLRADSDSLRLVCSWSAGECANAFNNLQYTVDSDDSRHTAPLAIGNMDSDDDLEIFLAAKRDSVVQDSEGVRTHGFILDVVSGPNLAGIAVVDSIPRPSESQPLLTHWPFGEPVIANIDGDGAIEGIYTTMGGGVFGVEMAGRPNPGWPVQVGEAIVGTPVIGDLSDRGKLDLVVLDRGGTLHLLQSDEEVAELEWTQFGGDPGHSFVYQGGLSRPSKEAGVVEVGLEPNAPNPFNPSTRLRFHVPAEGPAKVRVYDVSGRLVRVLVDGRVDAGVHEVAWDGRDEKGRAVPSGIYFGDLQFGGRRTARKMVLMK